jgi:hypothetical protein
VKDKILANYFPPAWALIAALATDFNGPDTKRVSVSLGLLKMLIRQSLKSTSFDEELYLSANQDVQLAYNQGKIEDVHSHWIEVGYFEGRRAFNQELDEEWYLDRYSDVGAAVANGSVKGAKEHYIENGEREWRIPNAAIEPELRAWRQALLNQVAPIK